MGGKHRAPRKRRLLTTQHLARVAGVTAVGAVISLAAVSPASAEESDTSQVNLLRKLIDCESDGNPAAKNRSSSASGLWQIIDSTWRANGGSEFAPTARQASVSEQNTVAIRISRSQGADAWVCAPRGLREPFRPADVAAATGASKSPAPSPTPRKREVTVPRGSYTVVPGDTLSKIALRAGDDWRDLYRVNADVIGDNPNVIYPGQILNTRSVA